MCLRGLVQMAGSVFVHQHNAPACRTGTLERSSDHDLWNSCGHRAVTDLKGFGHGFTSLLCVTRQEKSLGLRKKRC